MVRLIVNMISQAGHVTRHHATNVGWVSEAPPIDGAFIPTNDGLRCAYPSYARFTDSELSRSKHARCKIQDLCTTRVCLASTSGKILVLEDNGSHVIRVERNAHQRQSFSDGHIEASRSCQKMRPLSGTKYLVAEQLTQDNRYRN